MRFILLIVFIVGITKMMAQVPADTRPLDSVTMKKILVVINGVVQKNRGVQQLDSVIKTDQIDP